MKRASLELIVGIFMLVGLACLAYISIRLGKMEIFGSDSYRVVAEFDSVSGLKTGASVEIAGVDIGHVDSITLDPETKEAKVGLSIRSDIALQDDVIAAVRTRGIIGDKFIKLKPGGSERKIGPGGKIRETESSVDLEELLSKYIHGNVE
jgi:phospholipid/cholesterol/gamma-HCH transport system substrate-binding protein